MTIIYEDMPVTGLSKASSVSEAFVWDTESDWDNLKSDESSAHNAIDGNSGDGSVNVGYDLGSIAKGLVAYYPFDGDANDKTELGNDGTVNGATLNGSGKVGSDCYSFDGSNDEIDLGFQASPSPYSVSAWAINDSAGNHNIIGSNDGTNEAWFGFDSTGQNQFNFYHYDGSSVLGMSGISLPNSTGVWRHYAGVFTGGEWRLYQDGSLVNTAPENNTSWPSSNLYIGSQGGTNYHDGLIDDVRLYDRALSQPEIATLADRTTTQKINAGMTLQ